MGEPDTPRTLADLQQYLVDEYVENYQEGALSRRDALRYIAAVTGNPGFLPHGPASSIAIALLRHSTAAP